MKKLAVIYWSGTGNTEEMARLVAEGAGQAGTQAELLTCAQVGADTAAGYDGFALGCPAMGAEQLEENEFEPMYQGLRGSLSGKPVVLFGSYGWGSGEWMETWAEDLAQAGGRMPAEPVIVNGMPEGDDAAACTALGAALANA